MTPSHVHVIGAGVAGLATAISLAERGIRVTVHEAGPAAGGRCRSYFDRELGCRIDNGNHLLLSGNHATFAYLQQVGSAGTMAGPGAPVFPFMDLQSGERWAVRPNRGRAPWWLLSPARRVPGTGLGEYLDLLRLRRAGPDATVAGSLHHGALYRRLLEPLAIAALNTRPEEGSAQLLAAVVAESLAAGGAACIPCYPKDGLSETFIDPALAYLRSHGGTIRLSSRIPALIQDGGRLTALASEPVGANEAVVLATPGPVATALLPGTPAPDRFEAILNLHYRVNATADQAGFTGLVGGTAEWVFVKPGVVSVTISAANALLDRPVELLAEQVWQDVSAVLRLSGPPPPFRVVREKRATFAATPAQERQRPPARTTLANLVLAGDWTSTGLPATIEGAIRSGRTAAAAIIE